MEKDAVRARRHAVGRSQRPLRRSAAREKGDKTEM